jgi:flagellar biosynthesis protein FliR
MFPRYPAFWAAIVAPLLWTGLLWSSLSVINPLLDARIEWRWFILCQIAFGAVAGFVVNLTERVRTMQHLPFAVRTGIETPGLGAKHEDPD